MKTRNALVLAFVVLLMAQLPIREFFREAYPMIVLPAGAGLYEHKTDVISSSQQKATVYTGQSDSATVPSSVLFPESPSQYHTYMYFSLAQANSSSDDGDWKRASQWIRQNLEDSVSLSEIDSLCIHNVVDSIPIEGDSVEVRYQNSSCHNLTQ